MSYLRNNYYFTNDDDQPKDIDYEISQFFPSVSQNSNYINMIERGFFYYHSKQDLKNMAKKLETLKDYGINFPTIEGLVSCFRSESCIEIAKKNNNVANGFFTFGQGYTQGRQNNIDKKKIINLLKKININNRYLYTKTDMNKTNTYEVDGKFYCLFLLGLYVAKS